MRSQSLILFGILVIFLSSGTEDPIQKGIIDHLTNYNKQLPQEKVYLHLDKPYYHPGDTVWMKAYLVDAIDHLPDMVSKVLYVDLIDKEHGKLILSKTLKVDNGFASTYFELAELLSDGNYQVRAYTNWMRNFPSSLFFMKDIRIYKDIDRTYSDENLATLTSVADMQFFPEGGDMITGLSSRVAFKAVNAAGNGLDVDGFILNSKNDTISTFRSSYLGTGYFDFKPLTGETYRAFAKDSRKQVRPFPLPTPASEGFVMAVDNISSKSELRIFITHNFTNQKNLTIIAQQRGTIQYAAEVADPKKSFLIRVPRTKFPNDGVVHITLFDQQGKPRCERLIYVNNGKALLAEINPDKKEYQPREKVTMSITVKDADGKPVEGNFSLAVTDENQIIHEPYGENIATYFQLSSDIGSLNSISKTIEQPAYYFDKANSKGPSYLDMLLMTQGWRRFTWDEVLNKTTYDTSYAIEPGLRLSGKVTYQNGSQLKQGISPSFMITADTTRSQFIQTGLDKEGKFFFNDLVFYDSVTIAGIQIQKEKKLKFTFDPLSTEPVIKQKSTEAEHWVENSILKNYLLKERQAAEYRSANDTRMLQEITIKGEKIKKVDSRKTMLSNNRQANIYKIDQNSCGGARSAFQLIQARFSGVTITGTAGNYSALIRGANSFLQSSEPLYLIDGIPVDALMINSITPCDIESVEVFKGPVAIFGSRGSNGVIAFYMRNFNSPTAGAWENSSRLTKLIRVGFASPREFYSPNYEQKSPSFDHRSTIYWQPYIITNADGKATVTFWNSDENNTDMKAVLEGISLNGKMIAVTGTYSVQ